MVYTVTLSPALDYVIHIGALSEGIQRSKSEKILCGGKGINVSTVLTQLGINNTALGFTAGFTGEELEKRLKKEGVSCDFCKLKNGATRINVKIRAGAEYDINAAAPEIDTEAQNALLEKIEALEKGDILVLSGSVPEGFGYGKILEKTKTNVKAIVDAEGEALLNALKYEPFLIKPNHIELGALFKTEIKTEADAEKYARELQKKGAKNVLVSRAENGAILIDERGNKHISKNAKGVLINSTGCGDSMLAGFIAGFLETQDYSYALRLGTACGNAAAFSEGLPEKSEIERLLNQGE